MKSTLKYISSFFLLFSMLGWSQTTDSLPKFKDRYGLRLGIDLHRLTRSLYDKDYQGVEFTGDFRLSKRYFAAAEIGTEKRDTREPQINATTRGQYLKIGFDYNTHQNWLQLENMVNVGLRYGFSTFSQTLNSYKVYNPNPYFGNGDFIDVNREYNGLTAHWIETVAGIKAQVFTNVFVGFSFRLNIMIQEKDPSGFENLYIPGYNRTYNDRFGVGFNYTVSYFLPLYKKDKGVSAEKKKKK